MPDEPNTNNPDQTTDPVIPAVVPPLVADDISTLFTPEEVTAKKEAVEATKAEETRRAALTDDERTAEDTAKAEEAKANEVPEVYADFKIPDGMEMDKALLDAALPDFKEMGLTQAKAQQVIDLFSTKIGPAIAKRQVDAWQAEVDGWKQATMKDPEIGGTKFEKSVSDALRVINTVNPALKPVFDQYGLGNHPEFVRAFAKIAPLLNEDTIEKINRTDNKQLSIAQRMFPDLPAT